MDHHINETELVSRKVTKHKFRKSIIEEWDSRCYICGEQFDMGRAIKLLSYLRRCDNIPLPDEKIS